MNDLYNLVVGTTFEETIIKLLLLLCCIEFVGVVVGSLSGFFKTR